MWKTTLLLKEFIEEYEKLNDKEKDNINSLIEFKRDINLIKKITECEYFNDPEFYKTIFISEDFSKGFCGKLKYKESMIETLCENCEKNFN